MPEEGIMQKAVLEFIIKKLLEGDTNSALEGKEKFNVTPSIEQIENGIPNFKVLLEKLKTISPTFVEQVYKSQELAFFSRRIVQ